MLLTVKLCYKLEAGFYMNKEIGGLVQIMKSAPKMVHTFIQVKVSSLDEEIWYRSAMNI